VPRLGADGCARGPSSLAAGCSGRLPTAGRSAGNLLQFAHVPLVGVHFDRNLNHSTITCVRSDETRRDARQGTAPHRELVIRCAFFFHCTTKCIDRTHARGVCTMVSVSTAACMHAADRSMPPYSVRIAARASDGKLLATSHSLFLKNSAMSLRLRCSDLSNHGILYRE
jgi:hypothetical protein